MSTTQTVIDVGNKKIGGGNPCFIAAEIGLNHNGDMDLAKRTIDAAADAGADAVKFQNYITTDFLEDARLTYTYQTKSGESVTESQFEMFKRCELSRDQLYELKRHADDIGVVFFSTPTSVAGVNILSDIDCPLLKNGSDFLTNIQLIQIMAQTGIPTALSTGMATIADVDAAVRAFRASGGKELILLHCTSSYPTPASEINLKRISTLSRAFDCICGFSDHSEGTYAATGSIVLGAKFIEKHFTLDRSLPGPDHRFSSNPDEMRELVAAIRNIEEAVGSSAIHPTESELEGRNSFRLSCVATRDLPLGLVIQESDFGFRRPGTGVDPGDANKIVGLTLSRSVEKGTPICWGDFHE